ncbi:MAG: UDP-2,3-diacylglucosamine diphosphatase [Gammaproteobacteria bacterium]|nr:UDP-2,3-diacylglucosamine diphosphatase [Gammaproteobacteria bacterium]
MATLLISDLHLSRERPALSRLMLAFLHHGLTNTRQLYILGDLFEVWIGDDAIPDEYQQVIAALHDCRRRGIELYFMAGNRDFLCGGGFAAASGCTLLEEPQVLRLAGQDTLLMHGDTLCSDDQDYQQFRRRVRDPYFIRDFLAKPLAERQTIARHYRQQSQLRSSQKSYQDMDVNQQTVASALQQHRCLRLIHGHTHRPGRHTLTLSDGQTAERIVLGDWSDKQGSVLRCDDTGCSLETFTLGDLAR